MEQEYIKISELNNYIKGLLDKDVYLNKIYLKGEISNFKNHTRGHLYFTLKDDTSRISAVMFQSSAIKLTFTPEDGMNVLVTGRISAYPAQGTYQIYVDKMEPDGLGALYIEYEKLKKKLASLGLFNKDHKVPIPRFPERIGVITAPTGAAVKDIMSTIKRRYPMTEAILFPCLVQGKAAAPDIARQIKRADEYGVDTIIVGRGGGSIEDLWAFNEEIVAYAIYDCKTPIISAVGHEIDWTIADYVSDLRLPTPTAVAEFLSPLKSTFIKKIDSIFFKIIKLFLKIIDNQLIKISNLYHNILSTIGKKYYNKLAILRCNIYRLSRFNRKKILKQGYALIRKNGIILNRDSKLSKGDILEIEIFNRKIKVSVISEEYF